MDPIFICPNCGNRNPRYIAYRNGLPYCRLCLSFSGEKAKADFETKENLSLRLDYPLSEKQAELSRQVKENLLSGRNVLIHAVTGAGKTELVYESMEAYLKQGLHVGFATPRKDVVVDLAPRIKTAFPQAEVISVYGSHSEKLEGDIITLTTHQLYRYPNYFDLLILDEIDAFPYRGNGLLNSFFRRSVKGNYVLLSATPSQEDLIAIRKDNGVVLTLFERYHKSPLPVPKFIRTPPILSYLAAMKELSLLLSQAKPVFVFAPTIEEGRSLFRFLSLFFSDGAFVSSREKNRRVDIEKFKAGILHYLVTTSILERGVTVKNLQVIVFDCDNSIYTQATLVQIAGRVGRKIGATTGEVLFLGQEETPSVKGAIDEIKGYNRKAGLL